MEKHENQALIVQSSRGEDSPMSSFNKYQQVKIKLSWLTKHYLQTQLAIKMPSKKICKLKQINTINAIKKNEPLLS